MGVCECVLVDINGLNVLHALCALCLFRRVLVTSPTHPNLAIDALQLRHGSPSNQVWHHNGGPLENRQIKMATNNV